MNKKPRKHHFIPQFWIQQFATEGNQILAYDHDDGDVRVRSSRHLMQISNLYTIEPDGVDDTTLETKDLSEIDSRGAAAFRKVLGGDTSSEARAEIARFFAAQLMRDPQILAQYPITAQNLLLAVLDNSKADYFSFAQQWKETTGDTVSQEEYDHLKSLGAEQLADDIEKLFNTLETPGGVAQLPFTDSVRDETLRNNLCQLLLRFDWILKSSSTPTFVLGDMGILYEHGALSYGIKVPLSKSAALYLSQAEHPALEIKTQTADASDVDTINYETG